MINPTVAAETTIRIVAEARGVVGKIVSLRLVDGSTLEGVIKVSFNRADGRRVGAYFAADDTDGASALYNREVARIAA